MSSEKPQEKIDIKEVEEVHRENNKRGFIDLSRRHLRVFGPG
jgi:hypothetical protein